jgi:hypothetical protein
MANDNPSRACLADFGFMKICYNEADEPESGGTTPFTTPESLTKTSTSSNWRRGAFNHGRKQWDYQPLKPIAFSANGLEGIKISNALREDFSGLDGRDDLLLQGTGGFISCRLSVR